MMMKTSRSAIAGRLMLASTQLRGRKREGGELPVEKPATSGNSRIGAETMYCTPSPHGSEMVPCHN
jgi:hypothetical protein